MRAATTDGDQNDFKTLWGDAAKAKMLRVFDIRQNVVCPSANVSEQTFLAAINVRLKHPA